MVLVLALMIYYKIALGNLCLYNYIHILTPSYQLVDLHYNYHNYYLSIVLEYHKDPLGKL